MKFLRQRFNKLCAALNVDTEQFITESLDRKLNRIIALSAEDRFNNDKMQSNVFSAAESEYCESFQSAVEIHA